MADPVTGPRAPASPSGAVTRVSMRYARASRFGLPEPVEPTEPFDPECSAPGPFPPQRAEEPRVVPGMILGDIDEDCLRLEVWSPDLGGRRPVLVWIPGGAYLSGGASIPTYDGARLAAEGDIVVVGVTYRVGALGFLSAEGVPANLGVRDVRCALDWIRRHAGVFGGDTGRVVAMGESAGAGLLAHLLTDPTLPIDGGIVQSGSPGSALAPDVAATVTSTMLTEAGVDSVDELRLLPVEAILDAQSRTCAALGATVGKMPFHPIVDGEVVRSNPLDAARLGELAPVPLVVGTTAHELELYRAELDAIPTEYAPFVIERARGALPLSPAGIAQGVQAVGGDLGRAIADVQMHLPAFLMVDSQAQRGIDTWRYSFTWEAPDLRACHALDLPFTFGTLDIDDWRDWAGADGAQKAAADTLSSRIRHAWASFVRDLTPACEPVGTWPRHTTSSHPVVELGAQVHVLDDPDETTRTAWFAEPETT